ncbi:MAG: hypothetical protein AAF682_18220 [Planctomycetota bacterium]
MKLKSLSLVLAAAGLALSSCASTPGPYDNHWNIGGLGPRLAYHGLSYRPDHADSYRDHQWQQKQDINMTLRRHFLNSNPDNPFQPDDPSLSNPRAPHSIVPDVVDYFHLESLAFGAAFSAISGTFIPVPIGSILGTLEKGGGHEFAQGIEQTLSGSFRGTLGEPAPVEEFRVRNTRL